MTFVIRQQSPFMGGRSVKFLFKTSRLIIVLILLELLVASKVVFISSVLTKCYKGLRHQIFSV